MFEMEEKRFRNRVKKQRLAGGAEVLSFRRRTGKKRDSAGRVKNFAKKKGESPYWAFTIDRRGGIRGPCLNVVQEVSDQREGEKNPMGRVLRRRNGAGERRR